MEGLKWEGSQGPGERLCKLEGNSSAEVMNGLLALESRAVEALSGTGWTVGCKTLGPCASCADTTEQLPF